MPFSELPSSAAFTAAARSDKNVGTVASPRICSKYTLSKARDACPGQKAEK